jgi:hypothetical protein
VQANTKQILSCYTVDDIGAISVNIKSSGNEMMQVTAVLIVKISVMLLDILGCDNI